MKIMQISLLVVSMLIGISAHADTARKLGETLILKGFTEEDNITSSSAKEICIAGRNGHGLALYSNRIRWIPRILFS